MLSAVIIAKDEEDRIGAALRSVAFADEVVVLDAGSSDATAQIATAAGARVIHTDWPGFVAQKNRAWAEATGEWVLSIDADEVVSDALRRSIIAALIHPKAEGFSVNRQTRWLGHSLRHGFAFPDTRLRLARRDCGQWVGADPHDRLNVNGRTAALEGDLVHDPYRSFAEHLATLDRYSALDARRGTPLDILVRPPWHFFRAYLLKGGFRDGWPGLAFAAIGAFYTFLKWSRGRWAPP